MSPSTLEVVATSLFAVAVLHTFFVKSFQRLANRYPQGSIGENFFHLAGEVEIVFGFWAAVLVLSALVIDSPETAIKTVEGRNFTEPLFVFAIMTVAATRPVIQFASWLIAGAARIVPLPGTAGFLFAVLTIGPLLGSFITEPAAMTVSAFILRDGFYNGSFSNRLRYSVLGTLFVNISIGGVLTHFAAPPVLMVARTWNWDFQFMITHFGWKAALACAVNAGILILLNFNELRAERRPVKKTQTAPAWLVAVHLLFLGFVVMTSHHPAVFIGLLLFFLGVAQITEEYQDELKIKESLLVAFFLAGLVVLGQFQEWWLQPLIASLSNTALFFGATALTAVTDNAALTYLGSLIPNPAAAFQYALVAGAVAGGGLTVIANAPNPAGYSILRQSFGEEGIGAGGLFLGALLPTVVAMSAFYFLP